MTLALFASGSHMKSGGTAMGLRLRLPNDPGGSSKAGKDGTLRARQQVVWVVLHASLSVCLFVCR